MDQVQRLSSDQIQQFLEDGVLVVENVLTKEEVEKSLEGLSQTLVRHGVQSIDVDDEESARAFSKLSTTNGSGGVLDIFYEDWKMDIATNSKLFEMTTQLWNAAYCHEGENQESLSPESQVQWHPHGAFDFNKGCMYIDRIGYRLPTKVAQEVGERINGHKKKKSRSIQRSLTPHLDCCPGSLYAHTSKWRPIQCFVSLTDNLEANTGGFEAAKGFHRDFDEWARNRPPTITLQKENGRKTETTIPAPCVGEYTHMRPKEDHGVMERVCHIPVPAGSTVFWDNRIPHANAYRHTGNSARAVVYCSFLPDVELNRQYVQNQLANFKRGRPPKDQWNDIDEDQVDDQEGKVRTDPFTPLGRKLMGIDPW
jgi:hypothetical protein